jgi:hypothetical protein
VGWHETELKVKEKAKSKYTGSNALSKMTGGKIKMPYNTIAKGGTYCWKSSNKKVRLYHNGHEVVHGTPVGPICPAM